MSSLIRNATHLGGSTAIKLFSSTATFVLLARTLGPERYGEFVFLFGTTSIIATVFDFGHTTSLIRDVPGSDEPQELLKKTIASKVPLALLYALICLAAASVLGTSTLPALLIAFAALASAHSDFLLVCNRALGNYAVETLVHTKAAAFHFLAIAMAVSLAPTLLPVAIALLSSKLFQLGMAHSELKRKLKPSHGHPTQHDLVEHFDALKRQVPYACENALVTIRTNIDTVMVKWLLGPQAAGVYQSGMNIAKSIENFAPSFANAFLHKLSERGAGNTTKYKTTLALILTMTTAGAAAMLTFMLCTEAMVVKALGNAYRQLTPLLPILGIYLFCRMSAMAFGVILTANDQQTLKTKLSVLSLFVISGSMPVLLQQNGPAGAIHALICGTLVLLLLMAGKALVANQNLKMIMSVSSWLIAGFAAGSLYIFSSVP